MLLGHLRPRWLTNTCMCMPPSWQRIWPNTRGPRIQTVLSQRMRARTCLAPPLPAPGKRTQRPGCEPGAPPPPRLSATARSSCRTWRRSPARRPASRRRSRSPSASAGPRPRSARLRARPFPSCKPGQGLQVDVHALHACRRGPCPARTPGQGLALRARLRQWRCAFREPPVTGCRLAVR